MPPKPYYGWVLVSALSVTETISYGVLYYAFTVFVTPMQEELGWSRAALTGAFSLALLLSGIAAVPAGRWVDRYGARWLMTAGSCAAALLVLAWSVVESLLAFYLLWAGIGLAMAAVLYEPAFAVVATWFTRRRGQALTVLTFIAGFASVIFIPLAGWLVEVRGWRGALLTLAFILALGTVPLHALLLRRHPADLGLKTDGMALLPSNPATGTEPSTTTRDALRSATFWWLSSAFSLATVVSVTVSVHLVPYLSDGGYSAGFAATAGGAIGVVALPGRLIFTPLGTRWPRHWVTAAIFLFQALALLSLLRVPGTLGVWLFVILFGLGFGAITPARAALVAETYGPKHYGSITGVLTMAGSGARALAPVGAGLLYAVFLSYGPVLWLLLALSILAAATVLMARQGHATGTSPAPAEL